MKLIMTKGLPASGKSTWAIAQVEQFGYKRVSKDALRLMLDVNKWSKKNEAFVIKLRNTIVVESLKEGTTVIVDDTNLNPIHEKALRAFAEEAGAEFEIKDFTDVPLDECLKRDQKRPNWVGEKVIRKMWKDFLKTEDDRRGTPLNPVMADKKDAPFAVIFDLDGTLACIGDRSPYNGKDCKKDLVNESVKALNLLMPDHWEVIIFSGRSDDAENETRDWLIDHHIRFDQLHMRRAGDGRKDAIVKEEMYHAHVKGKYHVVFIVDDRNQVVDLWRSLGLTCLQVAPGDF
jgi:predicted kinase